MDIVQIAKANVGNGIELIANGVNHGASAKNDGLGGVLGVITACVSVRVNTKSELVEQMRIAVPGLSKNCAKQLLNLVTGSDPETHLLSKHSDGTYSIIEAQRLVGQPSTAGVQ